MRHPRLAVALAAIYVLMLGLLSTVVPLVAQAPGAAAPTLQAGFNNVDDKPNVILFLTDDQDPRTCARSYGPEQDR